MLIPLIAPVGITAGADEQALPGVTYGAASSERVASPEGSAAGSGTVDIVDFAYQPSTLSVTAGDTVTWVNGGPSEHNAVAEDEGDRAEFFETEIISEGEQDSITFGDPGTYAYFCSVHPPDADPDYANFTGTITVVGRDFGDGGGGGNGNGNGTGGTGPGGTDPDPSSTPFAESAGGSPDTPSLPNTGLELLAPLIAGAALLALGLLLRAAWLELIWRGR